MTGDGDSVGGHEREELSQRAHRQLIGYLGLFLPVFLYVLSGILPTKGLPRWDLLDSVSAYYYTGAVTAFIGVLVALSLFLFTYRGYRDVLVDRLVGKLGGAGAVGVALCPTGAPGGLSEPTWWNSMLGKVHYGSAVVLFGSFILFSLWLFRKSSIPKRRDRPSEKRWRDDICLICGSVMIVSVLWAGRSLMKDAPIFWPEVFAMEAFGISWLAKGMVHETVGGAMRRVFVRRGK